jgi:hypothetical protein
MKPNISLIRNAPERTWKCHPIGKYDSVGFGKTPKAAYESWLLQESNKAGFDAWLLSIGPRVWSCK